MKLMIDQVIERLKTEEGFREFPYECPLGKLTIGYGINLESTPIPKHIAELWLANELNKLQSRFMCLPWFVGLDEPRRAAILDMGYQMGLQGVCKFRGMISAIEKRDYKKAAYELIDSKYAKQTPNCAKRNHAIMLSGYLEVS